MNARTLRVKSRRGPGVFVLSEKVRAKYSFFCVQACFIV